MDSDAPTRSSAGPTSCGRCTRWSGGEGRAGGYLEALDPDRAVAFGLVTAVDADRIVVKMEMQCGPHRVVSLMGTEAVNELGVAPGVVAVGVTKSTNLLVETPANPLRSAKSGY
ncbi:hypothetical protein GCM10010464_29240 [Pseudonocardia yunnanensis]|uniref:Mop domain-containing protein n=1 Tax=Pseudonocardia yunnanensis TaxID=58107 RepID=A0ABW4EZU6_9PSEU